MNKIVLLPIANAPSADLAELQGAAFADYAPSQQLAEVIANESAARTQAASSELQSVFGLAAFRGGVLVGWSQG